MATPNERPWSNHEKNCLLAEIIKAANPPNEVLLSVIRNLNIQPRWEEIPLPQGRSLNSSRFAYDLMQRTLPAQGMSTSMAPQTPMTIPAPTLKRPYLSEGPFTGGTGGAGREIRPKPTLGGPVFSQPSPTEPPPKRKRGRPTKAEAQAKAEAAAARSSIEAGPARAAQIPMQPHVSMTPRPMYGQTEELKPMLPPTTRMPIAAMLTPTTRETPTKSASNSSGSSGRKRRGRSAKTNTEDTPTTRSRANPDSPQELRAAPEDSPARTAVLRHRDDPTSQLPRPPATGIGPSTSAPSDITELDPL